VPRVLEVWSADAIKNQLYALMQITSNFLEIVDCIFNRFSATYWRQAPLGDPPLYKKHPGLFLQIFNILQKKREINFTKVESDKYLFLFYLV
jgi:hypothetical protein